MTRDEAIVTLVEMYHVFEPEDAGSPGYEFFVKTMAEHDCTCVNDIDRYAHLNTLFGYDIGFLPAMKIDHWLWASEDENGKYRDIETGEITYRDRALVEQAVRELGLDLSFDSWIDHDFGFYSYFVNGEE